MKLLWDGGNLSLFNGRGQMGRLLPCPCMVKTFKKLFFETDVVVTKYIALETKFLQMMTVGSPLTFLCKSQLWFLTHLYGKMLKWRITQKLLESVI